jgi:hypothetical protein
MQPVGDLCDLLGVPRFAPGVFDAMVDILYSDAAGGGESARSARLADLAQRMSGRG